jgi:hypothetical protein
MERVMGLNESQITSLLALDQKRLNRAHGRISGGIDKKLKYFEEAMIKQNGCCAICGGDGSSHKNRLHVDHDHKTGTYRGVLCHNCNLGLGHFKDDVILLKAAIEYIESRL